MARKFNNTLAQQASALLGQGGFSDDEIKTLVREVGTTYRANDELDVTGSVRFVMDAVSAASAGLDATSGSEQATTAAASAAATSPAKASKSTKASTKQQTEASRARQPRRNARDIILLTALENDWKVEEHDLSTAAGRKAAEDIRMMHPSRGRRDWAATAKKGKAVFQLSTIRNPQGGVHSDGCWLVQDGKVQNVEMLYEVVYVLSTPLTKDGFAQKATDKAVAKASYTTLRGGLSQPEPTKESAPAKKASTKKAPAKRTTKASKKEPAKASA